MKIAVMFGTAVMLAVGTGLADARVDHQSVTLWVEETGEVQQVIVMRARALATAIFSTIGVRLVWRSGRPASLASERPIIMHLTTDVPPSFQPGALASAGPYEGIHIAIFYNRIDELGAHYGVTSQLLAHVLVHEITHILQGISRHSATGIMKAHWTVSDLDEMQQGPLTFTRKDVELVLDGLSLRASRAAGTIDVRGIEMSH